MDPLPPETPVVGALADHVENSVVAKIEAESAPDFTTRLREIEASEWWDAWVAQFVLTAGAGLGKPTIGAILFEMNGLRYQKHTSVAGIARRFADYTGQKTSTADLMRGCAARAAMFGDSTVGLSDEGWIRLLILSMSRLIERLNAFQEERLKAPKLATPDCPDPAADTARAQQRIGMSILAEVATGMAICALWFKALTVQEESSDE